MTSKSVVRRKNDRIFYSENGYAFVSEIINEDLLAQFSHTKSVGESVVRLNIPSGSDIKEITFNKTSGLVPHTVNVYGDESYSLPLKRFAVVRDKSVLDQNLNKSIKKIYTASIQPTNVIYNKPASAIVYDDNKYDSKVQLGGKTVNITSKAETILPESSSYDNMHLTIQKNCFVEIKLPENTIEVLKLPDTFIQTAGYIKGTFTKSGEYKIIAAHPDGEQVIDITVPYYERLL